MIYGDLQIFDIIIFAAIAGFLVFRLINVLGKRTGHENTQPKFDQKKAHEKTNKQTPILPDQYIKLSKAYEALENFDHKNFLDGAKSAFETIINAFNKGDKKTLRPLLTPSVFKSFEIAIDEKKTDPEYQFYSLKIENVENVLVDKDYIKITQTNLNFFNPSGSASFFIHIFISGTLFLSAYFLFQKKNHTLIYDKQQELLLVSFFIAIFLCCFPRISSYDFFLLISSFFYIMRNSKVRLLNSDWNFIASLLTISVLAIYDSKYPAFVVSFFIFLFFYLQIRNKDPFYLRRRIYRKSRIST